MSGPPFEALPFSLRACPLSFLPPCLSPSFSFSSLSQTSDILGWVQTRAHCRARTRVSGCDLGTVSQQTDKHIAVAVVHQLQAETPPSLDLDQAFCHYCFFNSLCLLCLSWPREATTSHSGFDLSLTVHSVLKDQAGPTEWIKCQAPNAANRNNSGGISMGPEEGGGCYF